MDPSAPGGESGGRTLALAFADGRLTAAGPPHRPVAAAVGGARAEDSGLPGLGFLLATLGFTVLAWSAATAAWAAGQRGMAVAALLGGLSLGPCLTAYVAAPRGTKPLLRRLVLSSGGLSILAPGLIDGTSLDLEGFFALLAAGTGGAAFGHSLMMLVLGLWIGMAVLLRGPARRRPRSALRRLRRLLARVHAGVRRRSGSR